MKDPKEKNKTNAKIGSTRSLKNQKENQDGLDSNFIIGMMNRTTDQNSE